MERKEFEKRVENIANGEKDAVLAWLATNTIEAATGHSRGKSTISFWLSKDGVPMLNDTARGMRMSFFAHQLPTISDILDEEESLGVVVYAEGKRDIEANFR